jgi:membrane protease YdiL (CAAX protease family)
LNQFSPDNPEADPLTRVQLLVAIAVTALVLLIIAKVWLLLDTVERLPVHFSLLDLLLGLGIGLGITLASTLMYFLWTAYRRSADFYLKFVLQPLLIQDLPWLGLLPGLSEELLFRGVMLPALGLNPLGVIISSVCFGVLHMSGLQQWPYMIWATVIGLLLGISTLATGNLLVPIVAHVTTNLISSLFWKIRQVSSSA